MNHFDKINNRRLDLIEKMFSEEDGLSPKEKKELKRLQKQVSKEFHKTLDEGYKDEV